MSKYVKLSVILICTISFTLNAQTAPQKVTDTNTPLHALQPNYPVPYGPARTEDIKAILNRIYTYLDYSTPVKVIDSKTSAEITDMKKLTGDAAFEPGVFRLISYEWGVTYGAMLLAGDATGDDKFRDYTVKRINLIADVARYFNTTSQKDPVATVP